MFLFRLLLITITMTICAYTFAVVAREGLNLVPHFLTPIAALTWQGQFNLDFTCYLVLSGVWMAWRGGWSPRSIALGVLAPPLGIVFFAPYLIWLTVASRGDPKVLLLGVHAGQRAGADVPAT